MARPRPLLLLALLATACGARTDLTAGKVVEDAGQPLGPCLATTPVALPGPGLVPMAVDGRRVWGTFSPGRQVGWIDVDNGERTTVATDQLGVWSMRAANADIWWTHSGFRDAAGALVYAPGGGSPRSLHEGLQQPGGAQLSGAHVFYAEGTNSGSLRDEMRARVLRVDRAGGDVTELARGLGLPTDTSLTDRFFYWVDRRRNHIARVRRNGGDVEVVVPDAGAVASALAAEGGGVFFGVQVGRGVELRRFDEGRGVVEVLATAPTEVRGLIAIPEGLLLDLWYGGPRVGRATAFLPRGAEDVVELMPAGGPPAVGPQHVYWRRTADEPGGDEPLVRLCRDALPRR